MKGRGRSSRWFELFADGLIWKRACGTAAAEPRLVVLDLGVVVFARFRVMPEGQAEARLPVIHSPAR